jgi:hypothetical protein
MKISDQDAYALARAINGLPPVPMVGVSGLAMMLVNQWKGNKPTSEDVAKMRALFGNEFVAQIFAVDPKDEPPTAEQFVPRLPKYAQTRAFERKAGRWLAEWLKWAQQRASMTDPIFLESGGLWLISLATARRARLELDFGTIYNPIYALWCAPTTYHRKSTGLRAVTQVVMRVFPEMLLPGQSTPEMLLHRLAGGMPNNLEALPSPFQLYERMGQRFAGQRGIVSDEVSKLFDKDYMKGLVEFLLELYENPEVLDKEFRSYGRIVVRDAGVSILAATTPARLGRLFNDTEWEDGLLARFALLTPTVSEVKRTQTTRAGESAYAPPALTAALRMLFDKLPSPPEIDIEAGGVGALSSVQMSISDEALDGFNAYADALHDMVQPGRGLDERLTGTYGRLPIMAVKVAQSLALIDWATEAIQALEIDSAHWGRAQEIVERWRLSSHRLLSDLTRSADQKTEDRLMDVIAGSRRPLGKLEWYRAARIGSRSDAFKAIDALFEAGKVSKQATSSGDGYILAF